MADYLVSLKGKPYLDRMRAFSPEKILEQTLPIGNGFVTQWSLLWPKGNSFEMIGVGDFPLINDAPEIYACHRGNDLGLVLVAGRVSGLPQQRSDGHISRLNERVFGLLQAQSLAILAALKLGEPDRLSKQNTPISIR